MTPDTLRVGQASDVGRVRSLNQDTVSCFVPEDEVQFRDKGALFLVADGMGGHRAGEVASQEAVDRVREGYYAATTSDADAPGGTGVILKRAFEAANDAVWTLAQADPSLAGMGTTLVAAVIRGGKAVIANVGDSRAYLLRGKEFAQITVDHSWVEEQIRAGELTHEQARKHPQRNLITRALGTRPEVAVDLFEVPLRDGDLLLLCTDGLTGQVAPRDVAAVIAELPPQEAADELVARANGRGGIDNVSVVIVQVGARARRVSLPPAVGNLRAADRRQQLAVGLAVLVVACVVAMILGFPVVNQRFVGDPAAAPQPAAIHFEDLHREDLARVAAELGYVGTEDLLAAQPDGLPAAGSFAADLEPAQPGVFVVGLVREWACRDRLCSFGLEMAGQPYQFQLDGAFFVAAEQSLRGRRVRAFGQRQRDEQVWEERLIDLGARWWAWWQPGWSTVYVDERWEEPLWVYSVADRNPYSVVRLEDHPALGRGDEILARGRWLAPGPAEGMAFAADAVYRLEGGAYRPVAAASELRPQPTATLRPTATAQVP